MQYQYLSNLGPEHIYESTVNINWSTQYVQNKGAKIHCDQLQTYFISSFSPLWFSLWPQ